jgi:hypothetical protein
MLPWVIDAPPRLCFGFHAQLLQNQAVTGGEGPFLGNVGNLPLALFGGQEVCHVCLLGFGALLDGVDVEDDGG